MAALFVDPCESGDPCEDDIMRLVSLSDSLRDMGILMVQTSDQGYIERLRLRSRPPALGLFRNGGEPILFDGNLESETSVMKFLTDPDNVLIDGAIEKIDVR